MVYTHVKWGNAHLFYCIRSAALFVWVSQFSPAERTTLFLEGKKKELTNFEKQEGKDFEEEKVYFQISEKSAFNIIHSLTVLSFLSGHSLPAFLCGFQRVLSGAHLFIVPSDLSLSFRNLAAA